MLDDCKNPEPVRGFFNEYLNSELTPHRKVFEVLADKMKTPYQEHQLSGLVGVTGLLFDADKLKRSINAALSRRAEANVVTRRYGLRQQVLYLMYYGEE